MAKTATTLEAYEIHLTPDGELAAISFRTAHGLFGFMFNRKQAKKLASAFAEAAKAIERPTGQRQ